MTGRPVPSKGTGSSWRGSDGGGQSVLYSTQHSLPGTGEVYTGLLMAYASSGQGLWEVLAVVSSPRHLHHSLSGISQDQLYLPRSSGSGLLSERYAKDATTPLPPRPRLSGVLSSPRSHPHESLRQPHPRGQECAPMSFQMRSPRTREGPLRPPPFVSSAVPASLVPTGHCSTSELLQ